MNKNINEDTNIEKNYASFINLGDTVKWIIIILTILKVLALSSATGTIDSFIEFYSIITPIITGIVSAIVASMIIKWFGYALKCLYDIRKATALNYNKAIEKENNK